MNVRLIVGVTLMLSPFVVLFGVMVSDLGWLDTLTIVGIATVIGAVVAVGIYLVGSS